MQILLLDGKAQSAEFDEAVYHEVSCRGLARHCPSIIDSDDPLLVTANVELTSTLPMHNYVPSCAPSAAGPPRHAPPPQPQDCLHLRRYESSAHRAVRITLLRSPTSQFHPPVPLEPHGIPIPAAAGGEGSTAREVLRHKSVEKCVMVDIDKVQP